MDNLNTTVGYVILVDEQDNQIGVMEKLEAHKSPKLHRAISVVIFDSEIYDESNKLNSIPTLNTNSKMLIHKRASTKYHCPGLWTNTCCTHSMPGEETRNAAVRRLKQEMGIDCDVLIIDLNEKFSFIYKKEFDNGLTEWELDHVFIGKVNDALVVDSDELIKPNPDEVEEWKWININELKQDISDNPEKYTYWFKIIMGKL